MGAAKFNPTAIAAKRGELPPKPRPMPKRQRDALLMGYIADRTGLT